MLSEFLHAYFCSKKAFQYTSSSFHGFCMSGIKCFLQFWSIRNPKRGDFSYKQPQFCFFERKPCCSWSVYLQLLLISLLRNKKVCGSDLQLMITLPLPFQVISYTLKSVFKSKYYSTKYMEIRYGLKPWSITNYP